MRILIVEDDALTRMTAAMLLEEAGYAVDEVGDAEDALTALERQPNVFTHVFTDVSLPGTMDGLSLARTVQDRWPDIQVVITSGHPATRAADALPHCVRYLPKPWTSIDVLNVVI
ncbi:response regulator [Mangrovibrevibacter kandeliae]|uniref:response regulator n=1 Tax=Mangrovibrevibacter kandeliae TaxID=2968473 RepID=UPI002118E556|nr:response regulator [Aurantimonas sp. CSK15Z-1]MCQ8783436.1 response regulator [Aurantimonas sp. CSK15Z-1]